METKKSSFGKPYLLKRFVVIAIALCSVLLVALPAIAAEDDFVLGIYGNANEDDTIDMRDLTYVKLIFFGEKPETELADAKYDGEINPLDFVQIKLVIVGKEKELTLLQYLGKSPDITEKPVTINTPINKTVILSSYAAKTLWAFGEQDGIVGVDDSTKKKAEFESFVAEIPSVGRYSKWDTEAIMELNPDIVLLYSFRTWPDFVEKLNAAGIPVVQMDFYRPEKYSREIRNCGWMLGKQEKAEELINFEQQYLGLIEERVEDLKEDQKPRVYYETHGGDYTTYGTGGVGHNTIVFCGGTNIFEEIDYYAEVDPEAIIVRNPQVILREMSVNMLPCGYGVTDTGPMDELRNSIMGHPGWDHIDAVKNGGVYLISLDSKTVHPSIFHSYVAKWIHPELFEDLDPVAIHEEWFQRFLDMEFNGVYAYPTYPVS
ncbi:iron complex transport system substrate-binding protein [Methanophagales archaeon]|nr:iron complex transport system substrate-binding protein [Methanophagales archaeon]